MVFATNGIFSVWGMNGHRVVDRAKTALGFYVLELGNGFSVTIKSTRQEPLRDDSVGRNATSRHGPSVRVHPFKEWSINFRHLQHTG